MFYTLPFSWNMSWISHLLDTYTFVLKSTSIPDSLPPVHIVLVPMLMLHGPFTWPCVSHLGVSLISGHKASYFLDIPLCHPMALKIHDQHWPLAPTTVPNSQHGSVQAKKLPFLTLSLPHPLDPGPDRPLLLTSILCYHLVTVTFYEDLPLLHQTQSFCRKGLIFFIVKS